MAEIVKQLLLPEYGWKRIDSADTKIQSNTAVTVDANSYGGSYYCLCNQDDYIRFNFTGTKFRLICLLQVGTALGTASQGGEAVVILDGVVVGTFNTQGEAGKPLVYQTLNYELLDLEDTEHSVIVSNPTGGHYIWFDAVDIGMYDSLRAYDPEHTAYRIDQAARAVLAKAAVRGSKFGCTYRYNASAAGSFGPLEATEVEGTLVEQDDGSRTQRFNFVFVGYAPDGSLKFVADRNLQDTSWEILNAAEYCTASGANSAFDEYALRFRYRLPQSGLSEEMAGEWGALIVEHAFNETLADPAAFWHTDAPSWTLNVAPEAAANRIARGGATADARSSLASTDTAGFRPVLLLNPVAEVVHRPDAETVCPLPLVDNIKDILPGQAISCEYTAGANAFGKFARLGRARKPLLSDLAPERPDGSFHFICVGYTPDGAKKLVADRNIQGRISWEALNVAGLATWSGVALDIDDVDEIAMRLPGSLADRHVDAEKHGEWDAILSYRDFDGAIAPSDNAVWNCLHTQSWTLAVPSTVDDAGTAADPALRIARGGQDKDHLLLRQCKYASNSVNEYVGFRPVLIIKVVHRPDAETDCPLPLVDNIKDILPGQAISCEYTAGANAFGKFARLGRAQKPLLSDLAPKQPDGSFHFICVGYTPGGAKKLVADRNIQGWISWETLNGAGLATNSGMSLNIDGIDGLSVRLPGSLADRHVDAEKHGEWDAILSYRDFNGAIAPSDNAVWNCLHTQSWTLAVPSTVDDAGTAADPALRIARGGQDKDHLVLRQCKYASSAVNERVEFRPVLIVKDDSRFLYLKESDNSCYALRGDGDTALLEKVVENWAALSDREKREAFLAYGMGMLTQPEKLQALGKLRVLAYSLSPAGKATAGFSAVPKDQLVKQKGLVALDAFKRLDKVALTSALQDEGVCRVLVTLDHKAYLTFDFARKAWKAVEPSDLSAVRADGIAAEKLGDIEAAAWQALTKGKSGLGFAYLVALDKTADRCDVDRLALTVDVKGTWRKL